MYRCLDCDETFHEPAESVNTHYEVDDRQDEPVYVCPECGSGDYFKLDKCKLCLGYCEPGEDYCQEHQDLAIDLMADVLDKIYDWSFSDRKANVDLIEWWLDEERGEHEKIKTINNR